MKTNKTYIPKISEIKHNCYVIDASDKVLGRVAARVATILRGKHKTMYTPHMDTGDNVIIINAAKIRVTGNKLLDKTYLRYSGYPGGQRHLVLKDMLQKAPVQAMRLAVNRMIPKGPLGNKVRTHLKIYAGDKHPHEGQKPVLLAV